MDSDPYFESPPNMPKKEWTQVFFWSLHKPLTSEIFSTPKHDFHPLVNIPTLNLYLIPSWTRESFTQMDTHQFPDSAQDHGMFRLVLPDLLALLDELPRHGGHLRCDLGLFRLQGLYLLPIRLLGQLPENISRSTVV